MSASTRTCLGCEGMGEDRARWVGGVAYRGFVPCPACLGSGTVTERMGFTRHGRYVLDAEVDAATLFRVAWNELDTTSSDMVANPLRAIADVCLLEWGQVSARELASAAFRAVPALRVSE